MTATDQELLQRFVRDQSQEAFTALVETHLDLVYCAAFRQVRSRSLAQEVAQSVFTDLSRHAARLRPDTILTAWLYEVTRRSAVDVIRVESRRQAREQIAAELHVMNDPSKDWEQIQPLLDEAMHELDTQERTAVLLRYFENKSLREVGSALGTTEEAARKRVTRAVARLREFFSGRGIQVAEAGLIVALTSQTVQSAPQGMAPALAVKIFSGLTLSTLAVQSTLYMIQIKTIGAVVATAILAGTATYLSQKPVADRLRADLQSMQAERDQLANERASASSDKTSTEKQLEQARKEKEELLRLRGEVGLLRAQAATAAAKPPVKVAAPASAKVAGHAPGTYIPKSELKPVGYATPEAALESLAWATLVGTYQQAKEGLAPSLLGPDLKEEEEAQMHEQKKQLLSPLFRGVQVVARKTVSEDRVELKLKTDFDPAIKNLDPNIKEFMVQTMVKIGDAWKVDSDPRPHESEWDTQGQVQSY